MLAKRIIPCLDIRDGQTVKGINFVGLRQVGDPVELGAKYAAEGADELVYLDISASEEGRRTFTELVARIAARIDIPFTVGGGISSVDDASRLLDAGADKITLNSAAVANPALIDAIAARYGSQFVVAAIDARTVDGRWVVTTHGGRRPTQRELFAWAAEAADRGAGEILFTSMDHDGTKNGYPCDTFARLAELPVPIIASGGAGTADHIADVLTLGRAEGHAADLETELADACAQMADVMQRLAAAKIAAPGLSSVNVDGYIESYMNPTELARTAGHTLYSILSDALGPDRYGLLYRGMC